MHLPSVPACLPASPGQLVVDVIYDLRLARKRREVASYRRTGLHMHAAARTHCVLFCRGRTRRGRRACEVLFTTNSVRLSVRHTTYIHIYIHMYQNIEIDLPLLCGGAGMGEQASARLACC